MKQSRFLIVKGLILCLLASCFGTGFLASAEAELVLDGGFEQAAVGSSIPLIGAGFTAQADTFSAGNVSEAIVTDEFAHSGQQSLRVTHDSALSGEVGVNYYLALEEGKTYKITAWVRYDTSFKSTNGFYIRMCDVGSDFAWDARGRVQDLSGSDDFVKIEAVCTASKDYDKARINVGMGAKNGAIGYIDDISCTEVTQGGDNPTPEPSPTQEPDDGNLIANSGFESATLPDYFTQANCIAERTTEQAHEGEYSFKLVQTAAYGAANYTPLKLTAGKAYYYRAWARLEETNTGSTDFYIRLLWDGDKTDGQKYSQIVSGKDGWTLLEGISEIPAGVSTEKCRLNIAANPIGGQPVTYYIDDVVLKEVGSVPALEDVAWNQIGDQDGIPVCPTDAEVNLTFDGSFRADSLTAETILVNGEQPEAAKVTVVSDGNSHETVTVRLSGLEFSKFYTLSLINETWKDEFGRTVTIEPMTFKTSGRVAIGSKKLYIDNAEVTDGKLKNGIVRAQVSGLRNISGENENVTAILALFCDGEMIQMSRSTLNIMADGASEAKVETELNVEMDGSGAYKLILFVWDDLKSGLSLSPETVLQ